MSDKYGNAVPSMPNTSQVEEELRALTPITEDLDNILAKASIFMALEPENGNILYYIGYLFYKSRHWEAAAVLLIVSAFKNRNKRERRSALALSAIRNSNANNIEVLNSLSESFIAKTKSFKKNIAESKRISELHSHIISRLENPCSDSREFKPISNFTDFLNARLDISTLLEIVCSLLQALPSDSDVKELCCRLLRITQKHGLLTTSFLDIHDYSIELINSYDALLAICNNIKEDPDCIHWSIPLILANLFVGNQFFCEYMALRDLSIYLLKHKLKVDLYADDLKLERLLVFRSEFESRVLTFSLKPQSREEELTASYAQIINKTESGHNALSIDINSFKSEFCGYFSGKKCAIVGSAYTQNLYGEEIDSFDVIIRINYRDTLSHNDAIRYGKKVNVSYYNSGDTTTFRNEIVKALPMLDWAIFKRKNDVSEFQSYTKTRLLKRSILMYKGAPNGVQNALYEIHQCNPSKLKLFNTTFYCSSQNYVHGYRSGHSLKGRNWIVHDAVSNFVFTYNLWASGFLEADPECTAILLLGVEGYIKEMNNIYSPIQQSLNHY